MSPLAWCEQPNSLTASRHLELGLGGGECELARLDDLAQRLDDYAHNSSPERRHLMTDGQRRAADEASRVLGGD